MCVCKQMHSCINSNVEKRKERKNRREVKGQLQTQTVEEDIKLIIFLTLNCVMGFLVFTEDMCIKHSVVKARPLV